MCSQEKMFKSGLFDKTCTLRAYLISDEIVIYRKTDIQSETEKHVQKAKKLNFEH